MSEKYVPKPVLVSAASPNGYLFDTVTNIIKHYRQDGYNEAEVRIGADTNYKHNLAEGIAQTDESNFVSAELVRALEDDYGVVIEDEPNDKDAYKVAIEKIRDTHLSQTPFESARVERTDGVKEIVFPSQRSDNHFYRDARIIFYADSSIPGLLNGARFINGSVVLIYKGVVHFCADERWHSSELGRGRWGTAKFTDPEILRWDEFDHFKNHKDSLGYWLEEISKKRPPNQEFIDAFRNAR